MATWIIPLTPEPQSFGITLAGRELRLTVRWFEAPRPDDARIGWMLDIAEPEGAAPIVSGIPLVGGYDLLAPYGYLELGGALVLDGDMPPTLENLGAGVELCFVTEDV